MDTKTIILIIYISYLAVLSLITFILYGVDKAKAKRGSWRVSEKTLLAFSLLGGAFGGILGMKKFRHKTKKEHWYFASVHAVAIIVHFALIVIISFVIEI